MDNYLTIILVVLICVLIAMNYSQKCHRKKKMRYTCGVEGGCFATPHGTYESRSECEMQCGAARDL